MDQVTVRQLVARIYELMGEKLRVSGSDLEARVRQAGRRLPRDIRQAAEGLVDAERMAQDPRLSLQIDPAHTSAAYARCLRYLKELDPGRARARALFGLGSTVLFQLMVVTGLTVAILRWRGYL